MTTSLPTRLLQPTPLRVATVTLCLMLGGCTLTGDWFGDHADYKAGSKRTQPLEVPPDLTQLQRDSRYLPQGGVVAASDLTKAGTTPSAASPANAASVPTDGSVAMNAVGDLHLEHAAGRPVGMAAISVLPSAVPHLEAELTLRGWRLVS